MYLYDFNEPDTAAGAITTPAGMPTLEQVAGSWRILGGRAHTDTSPTSNPILAITAGSGDFDMSASVSREGGDCLYGRVVDAQNWIRLRISRESGWSSYTYYTTSYEWACDYGGHGGVFPGLHRATAWGSAYSPPSFAPSITHGHYGADPNNWYSDTVDHTHFGSGAYLTGNTSRQAHTGGYSYSVYKMHLEKCVNGVVTELDVRTLGAAPTSIRFRAIDNVLQGFFNGLGAPTAYAVDGAFATTGRQGLGRGPSTYYGTALDNLLIDTINTTSNAPGIIGPLDGSGVAATQDITFAWEFDDPDVGDTQTGFDLRYRKIGDIDWTVVSQDTANEFWVAPAGTFEFGQRYEWQVRTRDEALAPSPHSPVMEFLAVGYGSVVIGGVAHPVEGAAIIFDGVKRPVELMSVIEAGAKKALA